jgi:hypothetical protein
LAFVLTFCVFSCLFVAILMTPNPNARLSAKLHRRVCLVLTEDAVLAEELLARKKLAAEVAGRLSDRVLLVRPNRLDAVLDELKKMGHTPSVVGGKPG